MRFKIDENLPVQVAEVLNSAGRDALTVHDQHLSGAGDDKIGRRIIEENRSLVTLDLGFGDIRAYPPQQYQGIVVLRAKRLDRDTILSLIHRLIPALLKETLSGALWIVEEDRIRIRGETE